jgi:hypothetical protein
MRAVDTACMIDFELEELSQDTRWRLVLQAYLEREHVEAARADADAAEGEQDSKTRNWIPRLSELAEVDSNDLSKIHGKLIALGYLKFHLTGREKGMCYQVSPLGRQALEQNTPVAADHLSFSDSEPEAA